MQRNLLTSAYKLLKPGGTLVYSTCSIRKEENEENVKWFIKEFEQMQLVPAEPFLDGRKITKFGINEYCQKFDPWSSVNECEDFQNVENCLRLTILKIFCNKIFPIDHLINHTFILKFTTN